MPTRYGEERPVVLVVEDEPILRMSAVDIVEDAGFEALEAADAQQAIAILERRTDIRIVFSDIDMPGGHGRNEAGGRDPGSVAADPDHPYLGVFRPGRALTAAAGRLLPQALCPREDRGDLMSNVSLTNGTTIIARPPVATAMPGSHRLPPVPSCAAFRG